MDAETKADADRRFFQGIDQKNIANWEEMRREDPAMFRVELGIAKSGRILAADHPGSPQYAEAVKEDRYYRDERYRLWELRAKANPPKDWKKS